MDNISVEKPKSDSLSLKTNFLGLPLLFWLIILFFSLFKLFLLGGQQLYALGYAAHDDRYFIDMANNILKLDWLGKYNCMTLIKGPGYPLFIALNFILGIPLLFSQNLLYILACIALILALKPLFEKKYYLLMIIFLAVLFNPTSFSSEVATRVFREGIYATLSLFIVAFSIGILTHRNKPIKDIILWIFGLSIFLSFFWITREEGLWIMPFLILISLFTAFKLWKEKDGQWKLKIKLLTIPFVILYISILSISAINYFRYGVFNVVEYKNSEFLEAYGSLTRVKDEKWMQYVPVSKAKRMKIYEVSPSFKKLEPLLEGNMGRGWSQHAQNSVKQKHPGEIYGGWFMWAFRDAVATAGYYNSSKDAMGFYKQMSSEIDIACNKKELDCFSKRKSMTVPFYKEQVDPIVKSFFQATTYLIKFEGSDVHLTDSSVGDKQSLDFYSEITHEPTYINDTNENKIEIRGWAFSPNGAVSFSIVDKNNLPQEYSIQSASSPDVFDYFSTQGKNFDNAKQSRFMITTTCTDGCFLIISGPENATKKIPLGGGPVISSDKDNLIYENSDDISENKNIKYIGSSLRKLDSRKIAALNNIGKLYRLSMFFLTIASLLIFIGKTFSRNKDTFYFINLFLLILIGTRLAIIAIIDATSFFVITNSYLSPLHALVIIFVALNFISILPIASEERIDKKSLAD